MATDTLAARDADVQHGEDPSPCDRCGAPAAQHFGNHWVCRECYYLSGSCCLEFGGDDLWRGIAS